MPETRAFLLKLQSPGVRANRFPGRIPQRAEIVKTAAAGC
jgi:hypothetical protein